MCEEFIEVRGVDVVHGTPVLDGEWIMMHAEERVMVNRVDVCIVMCDQCCLTLSMMYSTIHAPVKPYIPYDIVPSFYKLPMATAANGSKLPARDLVVPEWIVGEICGLIDPSVMRHDCQC